MKVAPLQAAVRHGKAAHRWVFANIAQHYDRELSDQYAYEYAVQLQTGAWSGQGGPPSMTELQRRALLVLEEWRPSCVVVFGDANSSVAAARAAVAHGVPLVHIEAGVRTGEKTVEEQNRVEIDECSELHICATQRDSRRLRAEGVDTSVFIGDLVQDVVLGWATAKKRTWDEELHVGPPAPAEDDLLLVELHRLENTQTSELLLGIIEEIRDWPGPVELFLHPRVRTLPGLQSSIPAGWRQWGSVPHRLMLSKLQTSRAIVTDSGALQREAYYLRRRAVVVQQAAFWQTLIDEGIHVLAKPGDGVRQAIAESLKPAIFPPDLFGAAPIAPKILRHIEEFVNALAT